MTQTDLKTTTVNDPKKWHKSVLYEEMEIPKLAEENLFSLLFILEKVILYLLLVIGISKIYQFGKVPNCVICSSLPWRMF